jgi:hypothetical protein
MPTKTKEPKLNHKTRISGPECAPAAGTRQTEYGRLDIWPHFQPRCSPRGSGPGTAVGVGIAARFSALSVTESAAPAPDPITWTDIHNMMREQTGGGER